MATYNTINTINVGGIDKEIEDSVARQNVINEAERLDARIDNIIAPSGGAPSAAEVQDARIGEDNTTYNSLGIAIRTQTGVNKSAIEYTKSGAGKYEWSFLNRPYQFRMFNSFRTAAVSASGETYTPYSRAVCKIPDELAETGIIHIYNPSQDWELGVYYRNKSTHEYIGYKATYNPYTYFPCETEEGYDYYIIAAVRSDKTSNISAENLDAINRTVFAYAGDFYNGYDIPYSFDTNLIKPEMIHVGKYYYGANTMGDNPTMAYTDLIPVTEGKRYYFPYLTLGYSWYAADKARVLGGKYSAVETVEYRDSYITLEAPSGAAYIGVSTRSGDIPNMVLSEVTYEKVSSKIASPFATLQSKTVREPLNWLYNVDIKQNGQLSRLLFQNGATFDGAGASLPTNASMICTDNITMDKSRIEIIFSIPSGSSDFILGYNGYQSAGGGLVIEDGAICARFLPNGTSVEIRYGTGSSGDYSHLIKTVDISSLNIRSGKKFVCSIEKDTINHYIFKFYNALTPTNIVETEYSATQSSSNPSAYTGQIRGWGGPYAKSQSGTVKIHRVQMYSTAPTYPRVAIWGDSYVENAGRNPRCGYGTLIKEALDGNAFLSGRGGATAQQLRRRVAVEINTCAPQYIIFCCGVNDSLSNVAVSTYKEQLLKLVKMAEDKGAEPILMTVPNIPASSSSSISFCNQVNAWIRSLGYRYIDAAYALSTGDGVTADASKFMPDNTHPNLAGGEAIFNHIKAYLPDLIWK